MDKIDEFTAELNDKVRELVDGGISNMNRMRIIAAMELIKMNMTLSLAHGMMAEKVLD